MRLISSEILWIGIIIPLLLFSFCWYIKYKKSAFIFFLAAMIWLLTLIIHRPYINPYTGTVMEGYHLNGVTESIVLPLLIIGVISMVITFIVKRLKKIKTETLFKVILWITLSLTMFFWGSSLLKNLKERDPLYQIMNSSYEDCDLNLSQLVYDPNTGKQICSIRVDLYKDNPKLKERIEELYGCDLDTQVFARKGYCLDLDTTTLNIEKTSSK